MLVTAINLALTLANLTDYSQVDTEDTRTTVQTSVAVAAGQTKVLSSTETVWGSNEPCPWESYVSEIFDHADTHTLVNNTQNTAYFPTKFRSGSAFDIWRLTNNIGVRFTRERTDWVYEDLIKDPKDS